jgi:hypothetical protein
MGNASRVEKEKSEMDKSDKSKRAYGSERDE